MGWDIPGFCRDIAAAPKEFAKLKVCALFVLANLPTKKKGERPAADLQDIWQLEKHGEQRSSLPKNGAYTFGLLDSPESLESLQSLED